MDKIVRELVEDAWEWARLGRDRDFVNRDRVFSDILADLESDGDAMRYVDSKGRIAWKATPDLRNYLNDLKLDAEADLEDEEV
jgi:poly(A) polymerase Pap1